MKMERVVRKGHCTGLMANQRVAQLVAQTGMSWG